MLTQRQNILFQSLVETYVNTAAPVGSEFLCERARMNLSSATVRAEMNSLEQAGLLEQPFTSSGRVPTSKGYEYYIENILDRTQALTQKEQDMIQKNIPSGKKDRRLKGAARGLALCTSASIMIGFGPRDTYYTGIFHLFSNPEFSDYDFTCSISEVVDRLDEYMGIFFSPLFKEIQILVGAKNPLHPECSLLVGRISKDIVVGIFGPLRMNYQKNYSALSFTKDII